MEFTAQPEYDIRYTLPEDKQELLSWLGTEETLYWIPPSLPKEIEGFVEGWISYAKYFASLTATFKEEPVGMSIIYLMPYKKLMHQASFQLIVSPAYRQRGIGRSLLKNTMHLAKERFRLERLSIDVLGENPFLLFLRSLHFEELTCQEHFVKNKGEYVSRRLMECLL